MKQMATITQRPITGSVSVGRFAQITLLKKYQLEFHLDQKQAPLIFS